MDLKTCTKCSEVKAVDQFRHRTKRGKAYVVSYCRECERKSNLESYYKNPWTDKRTTYARHGLTKSQYETMIMDQKGICAIASCVNAAEVIDHDHDCCPGKYSCGNCVKGLLCQGCNKAEGLLGSDPQKAFDLAKYIIETRTHNVE